MVTTYTNIPKATDPGYTNVNPVGKEQYDQSDIIYDSSTVFYDGVNESMYTDIPKASGTTYTNIPKAT